jgi:two-component system sensor kinase FixL
MGEMASALAHELNQPLSAMANYLKGSGRLLERDPIPRERVIEAIDKAGAQALRAGEIIRRMRDFVARGETERRVESLPKLIEEASALALVGAKEHGVRVRFDFDPAIDLVLADKVQIQQVVLNLIRNAIEAMDGAPKRVLRVAIAPAEDEMATVSVSDTGSGLSPEAAEQLFQPFFTTKRTGMGVGLSISRTIVEAHGGRIWAEPNPEGGTIFRFTVRAVGNLELYDGD